MADESVHPDWLAVGETVRTVRYNIAGGVIGTANVTVVRHTKTSVVVAYRTGGSHERYALTHGRYVAVPRYLDYSDRLEPITKVTP